MSELEEKVLEGAKYIEMGDPLKDVMDRDDIDNAILMLAEIIKAKG